MRRFLFLHIHKTAGTSLKTQLLQLMPPSAVCPYPFEWQVRRADRSALQGYTFFFGHISPSALPFSESELTCMTMLREPSKRLLSAFAFWKHIAPRNPQIAFFRAIGPLSLLQFLRSEDPLICRATHDVQARLIAGGHFGLDDNLRTNVFGPDLGPVSLAELARARLDQFALVGVAERYAESLRLACELLGFEGETPIPEVHNSSGTSDQIYDRVMADPEIAEALEQRTAIDSKIHALAVERLDDRVGRTSLTSL